MSKRRDNMKADLIIASERGRAGMFEARASALTLRLGRARSTIENLLAAMDARPLDTERLRWAIKSARTVLDREQRMTRPEKQP